MMMMMLMLLLLSVVMLLVRNAVEGTTTWRLDAGWAQAATWATQCCTAGSLF
jgi:hypothetical protein